MKTLSLLLIVLLVSSCTQRRNTLDSHGNPVFNSIPISEDSLSTYIVSGNYYTIINNIDNPNSSVFVSKSPSEDDIIEFVRGLPSYNFIVHEKNYIKHMILVHQKVQGKTSVYSYMIMNPNSRSSIELSSAIKGDVTELRASELLNTRFGHESRELGMFGKRYIVFDDIAYSIQPFDIVRNDVLDLIEKHRLYDSTIELSELEE